MKTILLILSLVVITSCNRNEESREETNDLVGRWSLMSLHPGLGQPHAYDNGDIIWIFNSDNTIDVTLLVTPLNNLLPLNQNGSYSYNIISDDSLSVDSRDYKYEFEDQVLRLLDNPESDGKTIIFQKIEN